MKVYKNIKSKNIKLGKNVIIEPSAMIRGINGLADNITIGDNTYIGSNVQIICDNFSIGDYGKIHHNSNIHGKMPISIGHNLWCGQYTIIDTYGGTTIGDNCGIGAHSQLWSHIKYGDTLEGNRFNSTKKMIIGNDVWFVGHCIVSPINASNKSMAMAGSVITKDMKQNHIYAGTPAKDMTDKIGNPFKKNSLEIKYKKMLSYLKSFNVKTNKIKIIKKYPSDMNANISYFNVKDRSYTKRLSKEEISFMHFLLPEKAKFTPYKNEK